MTAGAARARRYRLRKNKGARCVTLRLTDAVFRALVLDGFLAADWRSDRDVERAFFDLYNAARAAGVTPVWKSSRLKPASASSVQRRWRDGPQPHISASNSAWLTSRPREPGTRKKSPRRSGGSHELKTSVRTKQMPSQPARLADTAAPIRAFRGLGASCRACCGSVHYRAGFRAILTGR
jgi:hypothetical protein